MNIDRSGASRARHVGTLVLLALAAASYLVACFRIQRNTVDDAFITFRFAQHLADGTGLVWNAGGPPTEGYTNFLWVAILAGCRVLGLDLETITPIFMVGMTLLTVAMFLWIAKRHLGGLPAFSRGRRALPGRSIHRDSHGVRT